MSAVLVRIGLKNNGSVGFFFFFQNQFCYCVGSPLDVQSKILVP